MANSKLVFRSDPKKSLLILYLSSASPIKGFPPSVRPYVRRAVHSSLALANRYINNYSSYSVSAAFVSGEYLIEILTWVTLTYFCRSYRSTVTQRSISYRYIKHRSKEPFELQCPSLNHWCIWWISRSSWNTGDFYIFLWQRVTTKCQGQCYMILSNWYLNNKCESAVLSSSRSSVSGLQD